MPRGVKPIVDVMGQLDAFGALNSRPQIETDISIEMAWHHTNTELPMHLPVSETVGKILSEYQQAD